MSARLPSRARPPSRQAGSWSSRVPLVRRWRAPGSSSACAVAAWRDCRDTRGRGRQLPRAHAGRHCDRQSTLEHGGRVIDVAHVVHQHSPSHHATMLAPSVRNCSFQGSHPARRRASGRTERVLSANDAARQDLAGPLRLEIAHARTIRDQVLLRSAEIRCALARNLGVPGMIIEPHCVSPDTVSVISLGRDP